MPLRVRCPHCQASLTAADDQAGLAAFCSECGGSFRMPMPGSNKPVEAISVAVNCARCDAEIAPGTHICPRCAFDMKAGKRLALSRRIGRWRLKQWSIAAAICAIFAAGAWVGLELTSLNKPAASQPIVQLPVASKPAARDPFSDVQRLFSATSAEARKQAALVLNSFGDQAVNPLIERLQSSSGGDPKQRLMNSRTAIDFVARHGSDAAFDSLKKLQQQPGLRIDALSARGRLRDTTATAETISTWCEFTRRRLFFEQLSKIAPPLIEGADRVAIASAQQQADRLAESLRVLGSKDDSTVIAQLLEQLFPSWSWLGQDRYERFAAEIWDAAKPPRDSDHDFKYRVRSARRVLDRTAKSVSPAARAAAGLVLAQCGPQYETLRKEIAASISSNLSDCSATDRQRIAWSLARLENRRFGDFSDRSAPQDATPDVLQIAFSGQRSEAKVPNGGEQQPGPTAPLPVFRVVTAKRQLEEALLPQFNEKWEQAERAAARWVAADLGLTARIARNLDPLAKNPNLTALACSMVIAARTNDSDARRQLNVWANAADQPAWILASAATAIAAMDARAGRDISHWPAGLDISVLDSTKAGPDDPRDGYWGLLIDAGGPAMKEQLRASGGIMPSRVRDTLLRAAESSAARTRRGI